MSAIGVFDSGVGGLTVAAALRRALPDERLLYLGDTARLPYGTKSPATVQRYTRRNVDFLVSRGVKAVVIACNTASALALDAVTADVPLWGVVEPGARRAAAVSRGRVAVLATESTVASGAYPRAIAAAAPSIEVTSLACPLFVPLVEEGWHDDPLAEEVARRYLAPLHGEVDTLLLGCTHYPLLIPTLERVVGDGVRLVDSAESVAREVARGLAAAGLAAKERDGDEPGIELCVTDDSERVRRIAERILERSDLTLELVDVTD